MKLSNFIAFLCIVAAIFAGLSQQGELTILFIMLHYLVRIEAYMKGIYND